MNVTARGAFLESLLYVSHGLFSIVRILEGVSMLMRLSFQMRLRMLYKPTFRRLWTDRDVRFETLRGGSSSFVDFDAIARSRS